MGYFVAECMETDDTSETELPLANRSWPTYDEARNTAGA